MSRNFFTWSFRSWSMLRASMARPRNSSTSSSGFIVSWTPRLQAEEGHRCRSVRQGSKQRENPQVPALTCLYWKSRQSPEEEGGGGEGGQRRHDSQGGLGRTVRWLVLCTKTHHLPEDFGVFGPGEGSVGDPAWHQPLVGVGSRPLHLRHHRLLFLLLGGKNTSARPNVRAQSTQHAE